MPPSRSVDVVVAGAGLAGACAALVLSRTRRVVVLEAERPGAGASGAAAGLVNPFMGQKARPAWRHDQALGALAALADEAGGGLFRRTGVLRPAASPAQADVFRDRARAHAELDWLAPAASAERWPAVRAPEGALVVRPGGSVELAAFVDAALAVAVGRGARVRRGRLTGWRQDQNGLVAITDSGETTASHLVLALGDGVGSLAALAEPSPAGSSPAGSSPAGSSPGGSSPAGLPLHRVKGQTVHLARPASLPPDHPAVAGAGYLVPGPASVIAGATFEHVFQDPAPDPALDAELVARAAELVPALAGAAVLERRAGVRLTVPASASPRRLPLAGELPGHPGVWVVSGLGAKGLLTAPLIAGWLPDALDGRRPLPAELWPLGPR